MGHMTLSGCIHSCMRPNGHLWLNPGILGIEDEELAGSVQRANRRSRSSLRSARRRQLAARLGGPWRIVMDHQAQSRRQPLAGKGDQPQGGPGRSTCVGATAGMTLDRECHRCSGRVECRSEAFGRPAWQVGGDGDQHLTRRRMRVWPADATEDLGAIVGDTRSVRNRGSYGSQLPSGDDSR
jgi:hypothetical protein